MTSIRKAETIEADIDLTKVDCPSVQLFIRAPFQKPIKSVILNGAPWQHWDAVKERITIPAGKRSRLVVSY